MGQLMSAEFKNRKNLFIPYLMAGDPDPGTTIEAALALEEAGADVIEWGVPYSDPLADGPVIEQAAIRSIAQGMNILKAVELAGRAREQGLTIPVVLFTYINPVLATGESLLVEKAARAGIDGLLIPDLPYEESGGLKRLAREHGIALIPLIAPTSRKRVKKIAGDSDGFLYLVSSLGVTGTREQFQEDLSDIIREVNNVTDTPVAVGFGISKREHVKKFHELADGVVIGSALVRFLHERRNKLNGSERNSVLAELKQFVRELIS
ncbi:tryptophan synthase subunit alpha [Alteribacter natronophilus]|uniref:tryptophan synthase subunit alpha n=1 Tax=Alteribacter natronophilus TaxID=2583810 RepID=UPI00110E3800|nr:tryptophan synthase subunit alpha [Alteribacter natronophilus]TMW73589.1 tryptophan synthase subunit alpha [Alteribacter natronophilus]